MHRLLPLCALTLLALAAAPAAAQQHDHAHHDHAATAQVKKASHPDPRPGVTAERVLPAERFDRERVRDAYRWARAIPQVLDGLYCHCDCHDRKGLRSLLGCFETEMAASCGICMGQARLAHRMHQEGKSLGEIRAAVDRAYGG